MKRYLNIKKMAVKSINSIHYYYFLSINHEHPNSTISYDPKILSSFSSLSINDSN